MFKRLWHKLKGTDSLVEALRSSNDSRFVEAFQRSTVFFLHLPPGCENGFDPNISQEELLAQIRKCAKDLSKRQQFVPLCISRATIAACFCSLRNQSMHNPLLATMFNK